MIRWFWSSEKDRTELLRLAEASLCPCSPWRASTMTPSLALLPHRTRSWTRALPLAHLHPHCPARHGSYLRKNVHAGKCLCNCVRTFKHTWAFFMSNVHHGRFLFNSKCINSSEANQVFLYEKKHILKHILAHFTFFFFHLFAFLHQVPLNASLLHPCAR